MLYFPQLSSGALGQYPIIKRRIGRTVVNECPDGSQIKLSDPQCSVIQWDMTLSGLTTAEWQAIAALFSATEGRLRDFLFLDPMDNLLTWSEEPASAAWSKDPLLELTAQADDPLGTKRATLLSNPGVTAQRIQQYAGVPGALQYCFSVFARSQTFAEATLFQSGGQNSWRSTFSVGPEWRRLVFTSKLEAVEQPISFGVELLAGSQLELFGFQVEAQPGASAYKKTTTRCGIYPSARFLDDNLYTTTTDGDQHSCVVRIVGHAGDQG